MRGNWLWALGWVACRTPSTVGDSGPPDDAAAAITIQDIQQGAIAAGTEVTLEQVTVSSGLTWAGDAFYLQQPGGGERSGLQVYLDGVMDPVDPQVGRGANVTGLVMEDGISTALWVDHREDVEWVEAAMPPVADELVGPQVSDWSVWEGGLVQVVDVQVLSLPDPYGALHSSAGVGFGSLFQAVTVPVGTVCAQVWGVVTCSTWGCQVNPRDPQDLVGCTGGETPRLTLRQVREEGTWADHTVELEGVIATSGLGLDGRTFFVQDPGGGASAGMQVEDPFGGLELLVGQVLDLTATVVGSGDTWLLRIPDQGLVVPTGEWLEPVVSVLDPGESVPTSYEGQLVSLGPVSVSAAADPWGEVALDNGMTLDDLFLAQDPAPGLTWSRVVGLVTRLGPPAAIAPRSAEDLVD